MAIALARCQRVGIVAHPSLERTSHRPWPLPSSPWIMRQSWCDLLFAHWPVPARLLRSLVPEPLVIQEFGGSSWAGVVPFRMEGVTMRGLPDLPRVSAFPELNLRLYVETGGKPGVWFVSLDATSALAVWAARRFFHLPYFRASMSVRRRGEQIDYRSERLADDRVAFAGRYRPVSPALEPAPGSLEHFLTERYCLYTTSRDGRLLRAEVHHAPWPLQKAEAEIEENRIAQPQGVAIPDEPPLLHFSLRQDVIVWPARTVDP